MPIYTITEDHQGKRLDKALVDLEPELSRARVQSLIKSGDVLLNGLPANASKKLEPGDIVKIEIPDLTEAEPEAQNIPLNIAYEDEHMLVINKQAGLVVHPGAGNLDGTLVNALLHHCKDSLSGIGGVMRPGIVHRLDKDTSGLMVVAKHDKAHKGLAAQLEDRSLSRIYHALVFKTPVPIKGRIELPIARHGQSRTKMAVAPRNRPDLGKHAITDYHVLQDYKEALSLVECKLHTGRTHQIRVHMSAQGHPLIGDPLYGPQATAIKSSMSKAGFEDAEINEIVKFPRQALHAHNIRFIHPISREEMEFSSEMPEDIANIIGKIQ